MSGCNLYLESLPSYIDGAPPWTPTNMGHGITFRPLKHDQEVSPRNSWIYVLTTYQSHSNKQIILIMHLTPHAILCNPSSFIFHVDSIPSHSSQFGDIELHLIPIQCHQCNIVHTEFMTTYITNHFIEIACQDLSKFIIHNPWITSLMQIHSSHTL